MSTGRRIAGTFFGALTCFILQFYIGGPLSCLVGILAGVLILFWDDEPER